jgi:hypothetical protein
MALLRQQTSISRFGSNSSEGWVLNGQGGALDESRIRKRFKRLARLSGIRSPGDDWRHTFATLLLSKAAPITYVASQLGHANPTTTLPWYARWLPTDVARYLDFLDTVSERDRHQIGCPLSNFLRPDSLRHSRAAIRKQNAAFTFKADCHFRAKQIVTFENG